MKNKTKKYTKKSKFSEIMNNEKAAEILMSKGMHCFGCAFAQFETLEQGCKAHGLDVEEVLEEINKKEKNEKKVGKTNK